MNFYTYEIQSPILKPYIQFILFNYSNDSAYHTSITYYPNNDVCLGIIHEKIMIHNENGFTLQSSKAVINSYVSGIYQQPHKLNLSGTFDEICLSFSPLGYYHFFKSPLKQYILEDDVLTEAFGPGSHLFFEKVFKEKDIHKRGKSIEQFLLKKLKDFEDDFIKLSLYYIQNHFSTLSIKELYSRLNCSEKKLQRAFKQRFDITPKEYLQILKFRQALNYIGTRTNTTLTDICYEAGYYDQSHFIRNINRYTGKKPLELMKSIKSIDEKVLVSFV